MTWQGQGLEQLQQLDVIGLPVIEAIATSRGAGAHQVGWVAVDQLRAPIVVLGQKPVRAAVNALHGVVAVKRRQSPPIEVDTDVVQRRRLALHDRAATEVGLDVGVVRRHHGNDRLAQPRGRLRSEIAHSQRSRNPYGVHTIETKPYDVKRNPTDACDPYRRTPFRLCCLDNDAR